MRAARRARERCAAGVAALAVHPRHVVLGALVAGLLAGPAGRGLVAAGAFAALLAGLALRDPRLGVVAAVAVLAGGIGAPLRLAALDRGVLAHAAGRALDVRVTLLERPRTGAFRSWSADARVRAGPGAGERVVLRGHGRPPAAAVGDELAVHGRAKPLAAWEGYERVRGAHAELAVDVAEPTGGHRSGVAGLLDGVRATAERGVAAGLPPAQAALARGMVLGQDDALDPDTRDDFRRSGLAHVLAASGQNVALLAILAMAMLAALGAGRRVRLAGALALVCLYVPIAGAGASIVRAGVMGAAGLLAGLAGRPSSRAYALLLAAAVTLALNPRADADVGWQLSFAAVLAMALLTPRFRDGLVARRVPRAAAEVLAVTAAATLGTAPLMAAHFGRVSLVSLPANAVAAAAVAPIVWLGTIAAFLEEAGQPFAVIAPLVNALAAPLLGFVAAVAHAAAGAPAATLPLALGTPVALAGAYAGLGMLVASRRARLLAVGAVGLLLGMAVWAAAHPPAPPRDLTVSFLDIGQGDATLLQHGSHAILVDTGPPGAPLLARLRAAGARRLDVLVLTHAQTDHEGEAADVLDHVPVGAVLDGGDGVVSVERAAIGRAEAAHGVRVITPDAGQVIHAGPLRLDVMWPRREPAIDHAGADPNARAIVALARDGPFSMLLTADAESDVTAPLALPSVDVVKVAHHGSADPGLPGLLARLRPSIAVIEVGAHNPYGHPAPSTLAALHAVPEVLRTDRDGTIRVTVRGGRMTVGTHP